ncbi:hypothetical protein CspeluHIS016_0204280 [Cutaneotrichosporon spelunceum]|uniref:Uncharacterized protein n=1 Tax=Cutaneotrichosporon spelunceum TaxID=1672016 RepID=A0AAD3YAZ8_9TREE|nr:hypothetical protein CspeluHIS016_0204280 [Cutaneotrichosporon spelunceum]
MPFSTRNAIYLRASNYRVVPLFLYLDERHVDWMSRDVLEAVITKLQPKIKDLLTVSRYEKKHKVYVERGEGYQYCYFLRNTTRTEVVLLKKKTFSLRQPSPPPAPGPAPQLSKKRKRSTRRRAADLESDLEAARGDVELEEVVEIKAEPLDDSEYVPPESPAEGEDEEHEVQIKDWKPDVALAYQGFGTSSVQLVLIIEPYPPLPPEQYAPPASRLSTRSVSVMTSRSRSRSRTGVKGTRYSSTSLALDAAPRVLEPQVRNMRNATRSVSVADPGLSWRGGSRNLRDASATPFGTGRTSRTPLFMPRDTPFDNDEEDEEEHEAFAEALRDGRFRLPSVAPRTQDDEDENPFDEPEGMMALGERLVHVSQIEESVIRNAAGWEEMGEGESSDVLGPQEPGD